MLLISRKLIIIMSCLSVIMLIIIIYNKIYNINKIKNTEGFTQTTPFILKQNENVYDSFYSYIYNDLFYNNDNNNKLNYIIKGIVQTTQANNNSIFLDVGSGTGEIVNSLNNKNYNAYGIEKSKDMVKISEKKCNSCGIQNENIEREIIKHADVLNPMLYEHNTFTHILLLNETIYEFNDKKTLIQILKGWLKRNGFLIIHFVSRKKYNTSTTDKDTDTDTEKSLNGVKYQSKYINNNNNEIIFQEKFTDIATSNIRQHEKTLFIEPITNIVQDIKNTGFIVHGIIDMKPVSNNDFEYLYIFENV